MVALESRFEHKDAWHIGDKARSPAGHGEDQVEDFERDVAQHDHSAEGDGLHHGQDDVSIDTDLARAVHPGGLAQILGDAA